MTSCAQVTCTSTLSPRTGTRKWKRRSNLGSTKPPVRVFSRIAFSSLASPLTKEALARTTAKRNGSISAEHGLGLMKAPYVGYSKTEPAIAVMQQIRRLFDPRGILSPAKYLPQASELPFQSEEERVQ